MKHNLAIDRKYFKLLIYGTYVIMALVLLLEGAELVPYLNIIRKIRYFYVGIVFVYFCLNYNGILPKKACVLVSILLLHSTLFGLVFVNQSIMQETYEYFKEMILFIFIIFFTFYFVWKERSFFQFIRINYYTVASGMLICFFYHFDERISPFSFYKAISSDHFSRAGFGFIHANLTAYMLSFSLIYSFFLFDSLLKNNKRISKNSFVEIIVIIIMDFFLLDMLFATTSRTAILSLFVFVFIFCFFRVIRNIKISPKFFLILGFIFVILVFIAIDRGVLSYIWDHSNREENITVNFEYFKLFNPITGMGYIPSYGFLMKTYGFDTWPVDMYYLYIFFTTGYLGSTIIFVFLFFTTCYVLKIKNNKYKDFALGLYLSILICGLGSSHIITYQMFVGIINWTLLLLCISPEIY